MHRLLVLLAVGFAAQLIDGALGMAYGTTSTTLVLAMGLAPATASATVHTAEIATTFVSAVSHRRFGNVDWRTVKAIGIPGALGAFVGAIVLSSVSSELAKPWMATVLLVLGAYILLRFTFGASPRPSGRPYVRRRYLAPLGLGAGFVDATGGGGWGAACTPTLLATGKMEPRKVVGSVDASEFLIAVAGSAGFLLALGSKGIAWYLLVALLVGGVAAAPLAAWLVRILTARLLGTAVGGLIVLTNVRTLCDVLTLSREARWTLYLAIAALWFAAVATVVRHHRRAGLPLTNRNREVARESP